MNEQETDIGSSQADLAGNTRDEIDDLAEEHAEEGHAINLADDIRALVSAREQRVREELLGPKCSTEVQAAANRVRAVLPSSLSPEIRERAERMDEFAFHKNGEGLRLTEGGLVDEIEALVRDAVSAKDERIAHLEQRIDYFAAAVEESRDVRLERDKLRARIAELERCNVALGREKALALAEAYRENERLRAEIAQLKAERNKALGIGRVSDSEMLALARRALKEQEQELATAHAAQKNLVINEQRHDERVRAAEDECNKLRAEVNDYAVQRNVNVELRSEVGRLHLLLQRANALLPPDDPVNQEIEREFETCTKTIDGLRAELAQWEIKWGHTLDRESETMARLAQAEQERDEIRQHYSLARAAEELFKTERDMVHAELAEEESSRDRMSSLLHQTANALKGVPVDPLRMNGWSDLPEVAGKLRDDLAAARKDAREMAKAIGKALDESGIGTWANAVERMVAQLMDLDVDLTKYDDGGE
jgi:hypothetical protein